MARYGKTSKKAVGKALHEAKPVGRRQPGIELLLQAQNLTPGPFQLAFDR